MSKGFCQECGLLLVFNSNPPNLGDCPKCHRPYSEVNLEDAFCTECGAPVEIDEEIRKQMKRHKAIEEIKETLPWLEEYGNLPE